MSQSYVRDVASLESVEVTCDRLGKARAACGACLCTPASIVVVLYHPHRREIPPLRVIRPIQIESHTVDRHTLWTLDNSILPPCFPHPPPARSSSAAPSQLPQSRPAHPSRHSHDHARLSPAARKPNLSHRLSKDSALSPPALSRSS